MTPERWRRVEALYHAALAHDAEGRQAFLARACDGDETLLREVESLLAQLTFSGDGFLNGPAVPVAAQADSDIDAFLVAGRRLGSYEVQEQIGAGGMGEVYRARDTRLGRDVAIKILPRVFTSDPDRLMRFEREARMLATLNHPHIGAIYGLEDVDGMRALVLELVDGETVADRIARGPLPVKDALTLARQIADALDAAHEKGIVHRDLKPANIKITSEGAVKVLDFGLAKAASAGAATADHTQSPTATAGGTREGVILGTAAYMSPEQARGLKVDKRTDIWAFGCVLYEMLTGRLPFAGHTVSDTIAAILEREPDWKALPQGTPASIRRLLQRSLEKDLKRRLRDIGDARLELDDVLISAAVPRPREPREASRPWIWGLAIVLIVLGLGWTMAQLRRPAPEIRAATLTVNPPAGVEFRVAGEGGGSAISPDGRLLAFVARHSNGISKLWIRPLDSLAARELPGTDDARYPFWSPDSASLGFFAGGKLRRVDVVGGLPTVICDVGAGRGGTWNEEGVILFNAVNDGPLLKVSATGGGSEPFTTVDTANGENSHRWPQFLPDGRHFVYFNRGTNSGVYLGSLDRPEGKTRLLSSSTNAVYAPDGDDQSGHLFWVRDGTLVAQQLDTTTYRVTGQPVVVAEGVALGASGQNTVSVSKDGTILYGQGGTALRQLTWYGRDGKALGSLGQPEPYGGLRISPDGRRVALTRSGDVWQMDLARAIPTRVTFAEGNNPVWSPDSQRIAYQKGSPPNLFTQNASGTGSEERLIESRDTLILRDWSADGRFLLYNVMSNDISLRAQSDLWLLPLTGDRKPFLFRANQFREGSSQFSPDGKWIAYTSDESGRNDVYVQSFPASEVKWPASSTGGAWPRWRKDGKELFYVALDGKLMSVEIRAVSGSLELGIASSLFALPGRSVEGNDPYPYDVTPDGQRFLTLTTAGDDESPPMTVVLNWKAAFTGREK